MLRVSLPRGFRPLGFALMVGALAGCLADEAPTGLRRTPAGTGPRIWFDMQAGIVPFPNDLLTSPDPTTPTGRRLNVSVATPTATESRVRRAALDIDGFGTFSPISVRFEAPLDVAALHGRGRQPKDDPVLILDLTPGATYGERIPVDLGRGAFPLTLPTAQGLFPQDPRAQARNLVFETIDEDLDRNGQLSPREDTDGDGRLDRPNVLRPGGDPITELADFYELETNTLLLRPVVPLRPGHRYAVVLTSRIKGADGQPIRSPFVFVHHTQQTAALAGLAEVLGPHGIGIDEVAFTWVLTTQSATTELGELAEGLAGRGLYAELAPLYTPEVDLDSKLGPEPLLRTDRLVALVEAIAPRVFPQAEPDLLAASFSEVDYLVSGAFATPYLVNEDIGRFLFNPTAATDRVYSLSRQVPFWCTVPKATPTHKPPFPVVVYAHDLGGSRLESLLFSGILARWGLATCALDLVDHGVDVTEALREDITAVLGPEAELPQVLAGERAVDVDGDGTLDPGARIFSLDIIQTRALVQQAAIDVVQLTRLLRSFDGSRRWNEAGAAGSLAGDFDGDGQIDLGGLEQPIHLTGQGFGGMVAGLAAGVAEVQSYAPVAAGGGWSDLLRRGAGLGEMRTRLLLPLLGPLVIGEAVPGRNATDLSLLRPPGEALSVGTLSLEPGNRVRLTNTRTGRTAEALVNDDEAFRVAVPADGPDVVLPVHPEEAPLPDAPPPTADTLLLEVFDVSGRPISIDVAPIEVPTGAAGWGVARQTPAFRNTVDILQVALEAADPINHVRDLAARLPTLIIATLGDPVVPVSSTLALARSAGLLPDEPAAGHAVSADAVLIGQRVAEGVAEVAPLVDPEGIGPPALGLARTEPPLVVVSADGRSALRFIPVEAGGAHGVGGPQAESAADSWRYVGNLLGRFFTTGEPGHQACLWTAQGPADCP